LVHKQLTTVRITFTLRELLSIHNQHDVDLHADNFCVETQPKMCLYELAYKTSILLWDLQLLKSSTQTFLDKERKSLSKRW